MSMVDISVKRYTTKHYDPSKKIPAELVEQLLAVLRNSPSSVNSQPWHFVVVNSDAGRQRILPAVADFNHPRVTDSSLTIVFCARTALDEAHLQNLLAQEEKDGRFPDAEIKAVQDKGRRFFVGKNSKTQSEQLAWEGKQIYIALGQALFAAAGLGIDSTAVEGFDNEKLDEVLGLPAKGLKSVVIASFGYHAENDANAKRPKSRLPREQLFTFL